MKSDKTFLLYTGYKCKAEVKSKYPSYISVWHLTAKQQEDFIEWWHSTIEPLLDKKMKIYERKNK